MVYKHVDLQTSARQTRLAEAVTRLEVELELPGHYPEAAVAEAEAAIADHHPPRPDLTDIPFVTIDPATSTDLDQAVHIGRSGDGYTVRYAIADVPAFIAPGGALDAETRRRGQTLYLPHRRIPLHPVAISEDAGSLLPGQRRGAYVWTFALDAAGKVANSSLERGTVMSRQKLDYDGAQRAIDDGSAGETLVLLKEVGLLRVRLEQERGGASLRIPEQEVEVDDAGNYRLAARAPLPVEDWNAQISLLTGMEAARIMLAGKVGILRTMPEPDEGSAATFRRQAATLGRTWDEGVPYGRFLRSLDVTDPRQQAIMHAAASLFRGAGYTAFDGEVPAERVQAAIAAPYAHTTAPLRRLVDRFVLVVCEHLHRGEAVPPAVREALPLLPALMQESNRVAGTVERAAIDTIEAALLHGRVGERFDAVAIDGPSPEQLHKAQGNGQPAYGRVQLREPAVTARAEGVVEAGREVTVELVEADIAERSVLFRVVPASGPAEPVAAGGR